MAALKLPILLHFFSLLFFSISAVDFVFNGFNSTDLFLYGNATVESSVLALTNQTSFSIGRALYPSKIPTRISNSSTVFPFSTSFIFAMAPFKDLLPGHGFVFIFVPATGISGTASAQNLGFLNFTLNGNPNNHVFGIEFDVFANPEFNDPDDNHVGINLNSLTSNFTGVAGFWSDGGSFSSFRLNSGGNYQVWVDYSDFEMNVTMAPAGMKKPRRPLINASLNLSEIFLDEMYVGFTSATGQLVQGHNILAWSFSNSNFSLSESLVTIGLPSFILPKDPFTKSKWFIATVTVGGFLVLCFIVGTLGILIADHRRRARARAEIEDWEFEYWPHRITYQEIESATKGFGEENVIGIGGNGKVHKGVLAGGGLEVAVKRISHENDGMREFISEITSIGRLKHRNLVSLRGWCKKEKGNFLLVYDYMENGSLDKWIFDCDETNMLSYDDRIRILKNVASGVLYLHEGWESKVLHRDIKASNVLLDKDKNGRLGDFGLARVHSHGQVASTTRVVGTMGYIAPELVRSGQASAQSDVFSFGILILEVMCGRRPIEEGKPLLLDWVRRLDVEGELTAALDGRLRKKGGWNEEEVKRVLHLGLLCAHVNPNARPTMRQIVKILEGKVKLDENESINAYLVQRLKSPGMWCDSSVGFGHTLHHPTFEDFLHSSSTSLSWSASIVASASR
ncbi:L-type lectin-domain containing receptor kinase VII.1-like isoform X1 [Cucurbita moschata]|uniref:non-specific serine/threonine protein kinase n=1 Tax=Cucurbita moschata TaxID=3662 RepID=A0A6J1GR80_CUCMO|nr:L-type lectin-domain containing receptor kinase VII.1-like isoform X1 [Cucurbita moschata]